VISKGYFLSALLLSTALFAGCEPPTKAPQLPQTPSPNPARPAKPNPSAPPARQVPEDAVQGDFDGDGRAEYGWVVRPEVTDEMECQGGCTSYLRFSKAQFPAIAKADCIGGTLTNLGDLNEDGGDEIGLLPESFMGCWMSCFVYTYRAGQWQPLVAPFATHCNQWEAEVKPIERDPDRNGFVVIRYMVMGDTTFAVHTKSVSVEEGK
jgi:hypothetical protein